MLKTLQTHYLDAVLYRMTTRKSNNPHGGLDDILCRMGEIKKDDPQQLNNVRHCD